MTISLLWYPEKTVREVFRDCDGQIRYPTLKGIRERKINRITIKTLIRLQNLYCSYKGQDTPSILDEPIALTLRTEWKAGEIYKQTGLDRDTLKAALRGELAIASLDTYWRLWTWARDTLEIAHFDDLVIGRYLSEPPIIWLESLFVQETFIDPANLEQTKPLNSRNSEQFPSESNG